MGVRSEGHTKGSSQAKIGQFEVAFLIDQQILWLEISVEDSVAVAVAHTFDQLCHEFFDHIFPQPKSLHIQGRAFGESLATATIRHGQSLHVFLEIEVEELEHEIELVAVRVDNIEQTNNVGVVHFFEERDLADGSARDTLIFGLETDLFESNDSAAICQISRLVNNTVGTWKWVSVARFPLQFRGKCPHPRRSSQSSGNFPWLL